MGRVDEQNMTVYDIFTTAFSSAGPSQSMRARFLVAVFMLVDSLPVSLHHTPCVVAFHFGSVSYDHTFGYLKTGAVLQLRLRRDFSWAAREE